MKIETKNFELRVNDTSGRMDISRKGNEVLTGIEFFLNYDGAELSPKSCEFQEVHREKITDGDSEVISLRLDYIVKDNEVSLFTEIYQDTSCIDFHIENDFNAPKFGEIVGGISADKLDFDSAICYNNTIRGSEYWLKTVLAHFSAPWSILKPTIKHLFTALPVTIRKALSMFPVSRRGMDWDSFTYPDFVKDVTEIPNHTHCFTTKIDDQYFSAVASCGSGQKGFIDGENESFRIASVGGDKTSVYNEIPCGTWGVAENPYDATKAAYLPVNKDKEMHDYSEVFKHLGCCTWNSLYEKVSDENLCDLVQNLVSRDIPIKFVIIDDGWQQIDDSKQLLSFEPSEEFPEMKSTIDSLESMGVEYVGVWHALQGDWEGVNPEADVPKETLFMGADNKLIPSPEGTEFYEKWYESLSEKGIDFVKVDNQYDIIRHTIDKIPIYEASTNLLNSVYKGAEKNLETVLNCMSMVPECIHNDRTNISRNSIDYIPYSKFNAKYHLHFCVYNSLWVSALTHPDYDMFQSHDPYAKPHALARVLSGGPVYLTDMMGETNVDIVKKLSFGDGKIPMPDEPAKPTEDCLLRDTFNEKIPLKAFTKVRDIGLVEAFNVYKEDTAETVIVGPSDARLPENEYVVYGYFSDKHSRGELTVSLEELDCELFIISPIEQGFAVIGLLDVYNPPRGVQDIEVRDEEISVSLYQPGKYAFYCDFEPVKINGSEEWNIEDSILKINTRGTEIAIHKP